MSAIGSAGAPPIVGIGATEFSKDSGRSELRLAVRGGARRARRRRARAGRRRRHGDVHDGHHPGDRPSPADLRDRRADVLLPHPLRRRRGLRDRAAGGDGRRHRRRRRRGLLPRLQRALRPPLRLGRRSTGEPSARAGGDSAGTLPFGLLTPAPWVAMVARRYMHEYGAHERGLRPRWRSPTASTRRPTRPPGSTSGRSRSRTTRPPGGSPSPLRLLDCCQETDGGQALVVTSAERARDLPQPPAVIAAAAQGAGRGPEHDDQLLPRRPHGLPEMGVVARQLWRTSGLAPADIDVGDPLRPLHPVRADAAGGVRLLRPRARPRTSSRRHLELGGACRSTPTAASSARPTSTA